LDIRYLSVAKDALTTNELAPILILGGSSEATELARELTARGRVVVVSFAGRTTQQHLPPPTPRRIGGFGGVPGLVKELQRQKYSLLVDATHPFAVQMAEHAATAARVAGVPHVRLLRPPWQPAPGVTWHKVDSLESAAKRLNEFGWRRVFLSIGSKQVAAFTETDGVELVVRSIEPPSSTLSERVTVILDRGPFTVEAERALLQEQRIDVLVTRNSGGQATGAKLEAARELDIPVIMIQRPEQPTSERVATVNEALAWVEAHP
jgi:precorrin-6A/cobalt-precorrin-6A reductase